MGFIDGQQGGMLALISSSNSCAILALPTYANINTKPREAIGR